MLVGYKTMNTVLVLNHVKKTIISVMYSNHIGFIIIIITNISRAPFLTRAHSLYNELHLQYKVYSFKDL